MPMEPIRKPEQLCQAANLVDYDQACREFSWEQARRELIGLPDGGGLNIGYEAVDRHAAGPRALVAALRWIDRDGVAHDVSYRELAARTSRFANVLTTLGVQPGERVFTLLGRVPALYVAVLGTLKARCVLSPLFSAFGPEPVRERMRLGEATVLVTSPQLYRRTIAQIRDQLPRLRARVADRDRRTSPTPSTWPRSWTPPPRRSPSPRPTREDAGAAALHQRHHRAAEGRGARARGGGRPPGHRRAALDLRADDIFWCTADPGWVTGTSYGIIAPLVIGATLLVDAGEFDARRWYRMLDRERVTVWYTAPTAHPDADATRTRRPPGTTCRRCASWPASGSRSTPRPCVWGRTCSGGRSTTTGGRPRPAPS